ncbi:serine hydrolase [Mycobacterium sp. 3519A]|uniref:serine hydrolase domain-containing protein n=1 Tax=Mycobacterium sp. 3519A TaxID=2057184 RepID=UPI000C7A9FCE|nr:serine hydrolase [Mycobacterium sp. 3519A]
MSTGSTGGPTVTAENWQLPPFNRWAYWHVNEILPTTPIPRHTGKVRQLIAAHASADVTDVTLTSVDGSVVTAGQVMTNTYTDAYVVMQDGALVAEWYAPEGAPDRTHAVMSISKSVVGCVAAALSDRNLLDVDRLVTDYVPELSASGYNGATVRHVLDMRSGVRFREDYLDPDAEVRALARCIGQAPAPADASPHGIYSYLVGLSADAPHGQRFLYRSAETDVLGWVCERAGGQSMAELIATLIWQPLGAEFDAEIICDRLGTAVHDGGLCATARDLARFGQMLLDGGSVPDEGGGSRTVVASRWLRDAWAVDADARSAFLASPAEVSMPGGWYRNQFWFRPGPYGDVLLCQGIYGQLIHVTRRTRTVSVKLSTWPDPQNPGYLQDTLRAFDAIAGALAGRPTVSQSQRQPGVVAGRSRHGKSDRSGK